MRPCARWSQTLSWAPDLRYCFWFDWMSTGGLRGPSLFTSPRSYHFQVPLSKRTRYAPKPLHSCVAGTSRRVSENAQSVAPCLKPPKSKLVIPGRDYGLERRAGFVLAGATPSFSAGADLWSFGFHNPAPLWGILVVFNDGLTLTTHLC